VWWKKSCHFRQTTVFETKQLCRKNKKLYCFLHLATKTNEKKLVQRFAWKKRVRRGKMFFVLFDKNIVRLGTRKRNLILRSWAIELSWFFLSFLFFCHSSNKKKTAFFLFWQAKSSCKWTFEKFPKVPLKLFLCVVWGLTWHMFKRSFFFEFMLKKTKIIRNRSKSRSKFLGSRHPKLGALIQKWNLIFKKSCSF
jgi:hypothetical protein